MNYRSLYYELINLISVFESITLGWVSAYYEAQEVFIAMLVTAIVVFGLTLFALQTKIDFTFMGGMLFKLH